MSDLSKEVLEYFPKKISNLILNKIDVAEEIRIRQAKNLIIKTSSNSVEINYIITSNDILEIMQKICEYSIYSYQNQIAEGYITVKGGHRIGITGTCVIQNEKVINIKYVNSLNFRIARQVYGASTEILPEIVNGNTIWNTIIVSPPGFGKTTILKDIIRNLSSGIDSMNLNSINVGVVDERGEIAAMFKGMPQNDLGKSVDVIENIPKNMGIKMLIRSMAPQVIVADEIGTKEDVEAINYAFCSGVKGIFTCHGANYEEFIKNPYMKEIIKLNIIDKLIFLSSQKGKIENVVFLGEKEKCLL